MMDSFETCIRMRIFFFIYNFIFVLYFFSPCVFCRVTINFCPLQLTVSSLLQNHWLRWVFGSEVCWHRRKSVGRADAQGQSDSTCLRCCSRKCIFMLQSWILWSIYSIIVLTLLVDSLIACPLTNIDKHKHHLSRKIPNILLLFH